MSKKDPSEEIKEFLRQVVGHQERIKREQELAELSLEENQNRPPEEEIVGPKEEVIVPIAMKPFLEKEVNF